MKPNFCRRRKWRSFPRTSICLSRSVAAVRRGDEASHFHRFSINHTPTPPSTLRLQIMMFSRRVTQSRSRGEALNYSGEQCRVKHIMIPGGASHGQRANYFALRQTRCFLRRGIFKSNFPLFAALAGVTITRLRFTQANAHAARALPPRYSDLFFDSSRVTLMRVNDNFQPHIP